MSRRLSTVFVLQLTSRQQDSWVTGTPVRVTTIVYGSKSAMIDGLRRLVKSEHKRLKLQIKYEKELGFAVAADLAEKMQCIETAEHLEHMWLLEQLANIPEESKLFDVALTEERVNY